MSAGAREGDRKAAAPAAPYPTDGSDHRGAVRYHYAAACKRFGKWLPLFLPLFLVAFLTKLDVLLPVSIAGFLGLLIRLLFFCAEMWWTWRCARVLRVYPLVFRDPVEKVQLKSDRTRVLILGRKRPDESPVFLGADALSRKGWPAGIADGVWFAGDDAFGGAVLVPVTGELLFVQPRDWAATAGQRAGAGAERVKKARRAGIKRRAAIR